MVNLNYKLNELLWEIESVLTNELQNISGDCIWIDVKSCNAYSNYFSNGLAKNHKQKLLNKIEQEINNFDDNTAYNRTRYMDINFRNSQGNLYIVFNLENDYD